MIFYLIGEREDDDGSEEEEEEEEEENENEEEEEEEEEEMERGIVRYEKKFEKTLKKINEYTYLVCLTY